MERAYTWYHWAFQKKENTSSLILFQREESIVEKNGVDSNANYIYLQEEHLDNYSSIESGIDLSLSSVDDMKKYETLKWLIIRKANIKIIESIIEDACRNTTGGGVLFQTDGYGDTLLHVATRHEHTAAMKYFLQLGAKVNYKNFRGDSPIHMSLLCSSESQFLEVVNILVEHGAELNAVDENGNNFAHLCASRLSSDQLKVAVNVLITLKYAKLFVCLNDLKQTPLHVAILRGLSVDFETLQNLAAASGFNFNDRYSEGDTLLLYAARFGRDINIIKHIVSLGGDWKLVNNYQKTVLHCAVAGCNTEAIRYFISLGANVNARDFLGRTPMHHLKFARRKNLAELKTLLLEHGADEKAVDDCGNLADF